MQCQKQLGGMQELEIIESKDPLAQLEASTSRIENLFRD